MSNPIIIKVDQRLYSKEALISVLYDFSGLFDVSQSIDQENTNIIIVSLSPRKDIAQTIPQEDQLVQSFSRKLIDQQLRIHINQEFGHIRDLIVEEAFRPISK